MESYLYSDLYELEDKHWWHKAKRKRVVSLIQEFSKQKNPKIADIGCGTGKNVEVFSRIGTAWGVDPSKDAIAFCKKRKLKHLKLGTIEKTGFTDGSLDIVTILDVLEHIDNEDAAITELKRILKKDGMLVLTVPAFTFLWSQWDVVLHHKRRYTTTQISDLLEKHGFQIQTLSYMYPWLVLPAYLVRFFKSKNSDEQYASDFQLSHPIVNQLIGIVTDIEQWLMRYIHFPIGTSIICVAFKKGSQPRSKKSKNNR